MPSRTLFLILATLILAWQWQAIHRAEQRYYPARIHIPLPPNTTLTLGRAELAANLADDAHLQLSADASGRWWLRNLSPNHKLEVVSGGQVHTLRELVLTEPGSLHLGAQVLRVIALGPDLRLQSSDGQTWQYDGASLGTAQGQTLAACPAPSRLDSAKHWLKHSARRLASSWNQLVPAARMPLGELGLGGLLRCADRLGLPALQTGSGKISFRDGHYRLSVNHEMAATSCWQADSASTCTVLAQLPVPLDTVSKLIAGRTVFAVVSQPQQLTLWPLQRVAQFAQPVAVPGGQWQWQRSSPWDWPFAVSRFGALLAIGATLAGAALLWCVARLLACPARLASQLTLAMLAIATSLLAASQGSQLGLGWLLLLQAFGCLAICALPTGQSLTWAGFALATLLFLLGSACQLALGLAGNDSGSLRFFYAYECKVVAGLWAWYGLAALARHGAWQNISLARLAWLGRAMAGSALAGLLLQVLWGGEAGVAGLQPIEWAKSTLVILGAHWLTALLDWNHLQGMARWRLLAKLVAWLVLVLGAVSLMLSLVHDFSPALLLACWCLGLLLSWSVASQRGLAAWLALLLVLLALALAYWAFHYSQIDFDRLVVWQQPQFHPHSGAQIRQATGIWQQGGWLGNPVVQPWRLPEVQNDMTPAFFLGQFGALGGVLLLVLQTLLLGVLLACSWQALAQAGSGDFRARWWARWRFFCGFSYAALLAGQFVLSWGSNLQFLPVMGQPMPFLSVAGSMTILFLIPLQALFLFNPARPRQE